MFRFKFLNLSSAPLRLDLIGNEDKIASKPYVLSISTDFERFLKPLSSKGSTISN